MRPIPLSILNQSCTHQSIVADSWGAETKTEYAITKVYIEASNEIVKTNQNTEIKASSLLIFDSVNSIVKLSDVVTSPNFGQDDIITFSSIDYRILKIDPIYQANTTDIHHYEIYLR